MTGYSAKSNVHNVPALRRSSTLGKPSDKNLFDVNKLGLLHNSSNEQSSKLQIENSPSESIQVGQLIDSSHSLNKWSSFKKANLLPTFLN